MKCHRFLIIQKDETLSCDQRINSIAKGFCFFLLPIVSQFDDRAELMLIKYVSETSDRRFWAWHQWCEWRDQNACVTVKLLTRAAFCLLVWFCFPSLCRGTAAWLPYLCNASHCWLRACKQLNCFVADEAHWCQRQRASDKSFIVDWVIRLRERPEVSVHVSCTNGLVCVQMACHSSRLSLRRL
jgi:hypothetical protein